MYDGSPSAIGAGWRLIASGRSEKTDIVHFLQFCYVQLLCLSITICPWGKEVELGDSVSSARSRVDSKPADWTVSKQ